MKTASMIGRLLYALPLVCFGLMHLTMANNMAAMVPAYVPGGVLWVYITGLCLLSAAISIITGKMTKLASILLALLLLTFVLTIHIPGIMSSDQMRVQMAISGLLKDTAMAGAALFIASVYWNKE